MTSTIALSPVASDASMAEAASGLLALVNAAPTPSVVATSSCPAPQAVLVRVSVQRPSVVVSDISDDDDENGNGDGGNTSDAGSSATSEHAHARAHSEQQHPTASANSTKRRGRPVGSASFPVALMTVLVSSTEDISGASFLPDGRTFSVHNVKTFCDKATGPMRTQLRIASFKTFLRKLEQWGFVQVQAAAAASTCGASDTCTFYHPSGRFVQSAPNLARTIRRDTHTTSRAGHNIVARATTSTAANTTTAMTPLVPVTSSSTSTLVSFEHQLLLLEQRRLQLQLRSQRMVAVDRSIRGGVRYSDLQVGAATRKVVGAAMRALERDRELYQKKKEVMHM